MKATNKCACGKRIGKYATACSTCHIERCQKIFAENRAVVAKGRCPTCGRGLRRNLSMKGWWQCEQLGAEAFRKEPNQPPCNWQGFTE